MRELEFFLNYIVYSKCFKILYEVKDLAFS